MWTRGGRRRRARRSSPRRTSEVGVQIALVPRLLGLLRRVVGVVHGSRPGRRPAPFAVDETPPWPAEPDADYSSGPNRARGAFQGLVLPWGNAHTASRTTHARSFVMVLAKGKLGDPKDPAGVVKFERPVRRALRRDLSPASFRHFRGLHRHLAARRRLIPPPRPIRRNSSMMRSRPTCGRSALSSSVSSGSP